MKQKKKLVSIIIRTKNEERWITSCLKSILNQTYKNFEIIIVDNFSTDKTLEKVNQFKLIDMSMVNQYMLIIFFPFSHKN